jgi:hypothetical protein
MAKQNEDKKVLTPAEIASAKAARKAERKAAAKNRPPVTAIPVWKDAKDGTITLTKLRRTDFPKTIPGKQAYCKYQADRWLARADSIGKTKDPIARKLAKIASLMKQVALLKEEEKKAAAAAELAAKSKK